jgi:FRG domain
MSYFNEVHLKNWTEFKDFAENTRLEYIFRGQSDANWDLSTTLDRSKITENFKKFEDELITEFKRGAKFYLKDEQVPSTLLEWFSMLQHFGAPSRLLDFSKSPYIAAFFAFEHTSLDVDKVAIWVIDKIVYYQKAMYYFKDKIQKLTVTGRYTYDDATFEKVYKKSKVDDINCIFPVEPLNINQRYYLQQSIFLCQGNPFEPFKNQLSFLSESYEKATIKVTIPTIEKKKAIQDLIKMNINRATLFPGLDGFAKSLLLKYGNLNSIGETHRYIEYARKKGML